MKKILVTGSEGYIGSVLCPILLRKNYQIIGIDNCYFSEGNLNQLNLPSYQLIKKDIRDIEFDDINENIYAIVHLAALSNDPLGSLDEDLTFDINFNATIRLAEIAKKLSVSRFIFASSCSLYGQSNSKLTENSPSNPQTPYGKSKILSENELSIMASDSFSPVYLRNATAFGISPRMRFDIVVNNLSGFAKVDNEIKILGDGKPWRPLVHVRDICKGIIATIECDREVMHNESFNIGDNNENYQIKTIADKINNYYPKCNVSIAQEDSGDTRNYNVSFSKANKNLNYFSDWQLDGGIVEIKNTYEEINLNDEIFNHRFYTRLKQIHYLMENKIIDSSLRII